MARTCGNCTACCKPMPIIELGKPFGEWCRHCDKGIGCRIYPERPDSCKEFRCQWLMGLGREDERPDRIKVILDFVDFEDGLPGGLLQIWEVSEGALEKIFSQSVTENILYQGIWVSHIPLHGKKKLFQPPGRRITEDMAAALSAEGFILVVEK